MARSITLIAKNFVNLLYPLHCAACESAIDPMSKKNLCSACETKIRRNPKPYCPTCGRSINSADEICEECRRTNLAFDKAWSACLYEGTLKELIHSFKYKGKISLSSLLCDKITGFIKDNKDIIDNVDFVTFVPLHSDWLNGREYNQSGILASAISREFGIPLIKPLEKTVRTKRQNELSREERLVNLSGAFKVKTCDSLKDRKVLLVDDVMTTGATLSECASTLKGSGTKEVRCLTLARGI